MTRNANSLLIAAVLSLAALSAQATTIYDTLGQGDAYKKEQGWIVGDPGNGAKYSSFAQFSPSQSGYLSSAIAPIWYVKGDVAPIQFEVRLDERGHPGAVIALASASITQQGGLVSGSFLGNTWVSDQSTYWFGLATTTPTTGVGWYRNPVNVLGLQAASGALWQQPGDWFVQTDALGAFQLEARGVTAVPEPSTSVLLALGFSFLAVRSVRSMRRNG